LYPFVPGGLPISIDTVLCPLNIINTTFGFIGLM
jgi:hypothetical protein